MPEVHVFGTNLGGRAVGAGARGYGIPTKDQNLRPLPIEMVRVYVAEFIAYSRANPAMTFRVGLIGGDGSYRPHQIAPMFSNAPPNCVLPPEFTR